MRIKLYDADKNISEISVVCMFRNNEDYIKNFFIETMIQMESKYDVQLNYYIIENDSTDRTRQLLHDFIKTRSSQSKLLLFSLENDFRNIGDGKNYERLHSLGKIRNKLVENITPLSSQWCLFIDSNIYFRTDILESMFSKCDASIGMMIPYTQQLFIPEIHGKYFHMKLDKPTLFNHFYDTFSFYDKNNKTFWPYCAFEKCSYCKDNRQACKYRTVIPTDVDVVDVGSGFGGFALIRTEIVNDPRIKWDTASYEVQKDESLCEHFLFCYLLRKLTGKRIVIMQHVNNIYRTY